MTIVAVIFAITACSPRIPGSLENQVPADFANTSWGGGVIIDVSFSGFPEGVTPGPGFPEDGEEQYTVSFTDTELIVNGESQKSVLAAMNVSYYEDSRDGYYKLTIPSFNNEGVTMNGVFEIKLINDSQVEFKAEQTRSRGVATVRLTMAGTLDKQL